MDLAPERTAGIGGHGKFGTWLYRATAGRLQESQVYLDFPSVGATENIMMLASVTPGTTIIDNAAKEPEIVDLANFLSAIGAKNQRSGY